MNQNEVYQKTCSYYAFSYGSVRNNDPFRQWQLQKSPTKQTFNTVSLKKKTTTYNGKTQHPVLTVKAGKKTLKNGKDYVITYKYGQSMKTAGKKIVYINGIGRYAGFYKTVAYTINPAVQKNVKVSRSRCCS